MCLTCVASRDCCQAVRRRETLRCTRARGYRRRPVLVSRSTTRIGLYQCFLGTFTSRLEDPARRPSPSARRRRDRWPPSPAKRGRHFCLCRSRASIELKRRRILDVSRTQIEKLLQDASAEIGRQIATDALIIEDEPLIGIDLERVLLELGHRVIAVARTHQDALKAAALRKPGLVLADIRLADGSSGLDAVNDILRDFDVPVVFVTAYPEKLMTGERPEPTFLITKPFRDDAVKAIVSQVLFFDQQAKRRPRESRRPHTDARCRRSVALTYAAECQQCARRWPRSPSPGRTRAASSRRAARSAWCARG